jgi:hypothetical protein
MAVAAAANLEVRVLQAGLAEVVEQLKELVEQAVPELLTKVTQVGQAIQQRPQLRENVLLLVAVEQPQLVITVRRLLAVLVVLVLAQALQVRRLPVAVAAVPVAIGRTVVLLVRAVMVAVAQAVKQVVLVPCRVLREPIIQVAAVAPVTLRHPVLKAMAVMAVLVWLSLGMRCYEVP